MGGRLRFGSDFHGQCQIVPERPIPHRSFSEAVSTDVDGSWGGIETLDVPHTESPEEQATRIQAEQRDSRRPRHAPNHAHRSYRADDR